MSMKPLNCALTRVAFIYLLLDCATAIAIHGPTNVAQFTASCHSFSVLPGYLSKSTNTEPTVFFTTYDGAFTQPLIQTAPDGSWLFSHEFSTSLGGPRAYLAKYVMYDPTTSNVEAGFIGIDLPTSDADGNGLADFLQMDQPGTVSGVGSWVRTWPTIGVSSLAGTISRSAGERTGEYTFLISNEFSSMTIAGTMRLHMIRGEATLTPDHSTFFVTADWTNLRGITTNVVASCSLACFSVDDIDTLQISRLFFGDPDAPAGIDMHAVLRRRGNVYRGEGMFPGALETWWDDYCHWSIEVLA